MDNLIRKASLELYSFQNKETVKIAGVLNKLKNYLRRLTDREYADAVDELRANSWAIQTVATSLQEKITQLTEAIRDGDIEVYDAVLEEVRSLTTDLALELRNLNKNVKVNDSVIKGNGDDTYKYNREQWDDPTKRADIFATTEKMIKVWHPDHDVPVGKHINRPIKDFKWFSNKVVHIKQGNESGARDRLIDQTARLLGGETILTYEEVKETFENPSNFEELSKRLVDAIYNGVLLHYLPAEPTKQPKDKNKKWIKERQIGEMKMSVKTVDFLIPIYNVTASMVVGLTDMGAPANGVNKLVLGYSEYSRVSVKVPFNLRKGSEPKAPKIPEPPDLISSEAPTQKRSQRLNVLNGFLKNAGIDFSAVKKLPDSFWIKFVEMSNRLGAKPEDLAKVINSESGFDSKATNVQGGRVIAKGLNQLVKSTAKSLGLSDQDWETYENFPPEEQLKYVEKFFNSVGKATGVSGKWNSATQLYVANFAPKYVRQAADPNTVLYSKKDNFDAYDKNKGLDRDGKGYITAGDLARSANRPLSNYILESIEKAKNNIGGGNRSEFNADALLSNLFASDPGGSIEEITKRAIQSQYLPRSKTLITISSLSAPYQIRMKFAKSISFVLKKIIDSDVSIHSDGNKIEVQATTLGSQYAVDTAIMALCDCVGKAIEIKSKESSMVKYAVLGSTISKYAEVT